MAARLERLDAIGKIVLIRIGIDITEQATAKPGLFHKLQRGGSDRQACQPLVGDQQRLFHAGRLAGIGQFLDPPGTEPNGGGVAPIGFCNHDSQAFFKW